jgi:predicted nuclease of predicted toxin-antitoxin system
MLPFLTDEDFDGRLTSALLARVPGLDLVRVQDIGLMQTPDPDILAYAAGDGRIVLTHDRNTMTGFASTRVNAGQPMPGLFVVDRQASSGRILSDLEAMAAASEMDEWRDQIIFVPL